jgi:hypothetical protein
MLLDIIHRPAFIFQNNVSESVFYLRLQVKPTQLGPIDGARPYLRAQLSRFYLKTETEYSFRNVVF